MPNKRTLRAPQNSLHIAIAEDYEVEYWIIEFGVTREKLQAAINKVGNSVDAVMSELRD